MNEPLDKFDYLEPACPLSGGREFYYPEREAPAGQIPVGRILERVDALYDKNDASEAGRLLLYWREEARALRDARGELSIESELCGHFRKQGDRERGLRSVERALALTEELGQAELPSGATVLVNCATALHAFGELSRALPLYRRAEAVYLASLSPQDDRLGGLYNNMALTLADLGELEEAERAYLRALAVMARAEHGEAECAITQVNLAHLYERLSPERISAALTEASRLLSTPSLPRGGYYAFVLEKCAPSFRYFGREAEALAMEREARAIYEGA